MYNFPLEIVASAELMTEEDKPASSYFMNGYWIATYANYEEGVFNYDHELTYSSYSGQCKLVTP